MNKPNPLLVFFDRLRRAGLPLDFDALVLLLRAMEGGFGLENIQAFERICRTLWVKNEDEEVLFRHHLTLLEQELLDHLTLLEDEVRRLRASLTAQIQARKSLSRPQEKAAYPSLSESPPFQAMNQTAGEEVIAKLVEDTQEQGKNQTQPESDQYISEERIYRAVHATEEVEAILSLSIPVSQGDYLPVSRRQMKQIWRYLRLMVREGPATELDWETTLTRYAQSGLFMEPAFVSRRINRAKLLLCIDYHGSMAPFHALSQRLAETAVAGGKLRMADIYYFHNCPEDHLFHDPGQIDAAPLADVLAKIDPKATSVVMFSDAGAARGDTHSARIESTRQFIGKIGQRTSRLCWLNPLPARRWAGTSAGQIAQFVPMAEISRWGMEEMIRLLRGHRPTGGSVFASTGRAL